MFKMLVLVTFFLFLNVEASYPYNPYVEETLWRTLEPSFLPEDHPIKNQLDKIFQKRVTSNKRSLIKAGFEIIHPGKLNHPLVVSHSKLKGYLIKVFVDASYDLSDGKELFYRIKGAKVVSQVIADNELEKFFKVPKKWIYPLPEFPEPVKFSGSRKNFVLIVQDMDIYDEVENKKMWRSKITPELLEKVYILLDEGGLCDSIYAFNLPFSHDGKIAVIDTEYYHCWPVNFRRLTKYLSPKMQQKWEQIINR